MFALGPFGANAAAAAAVASSGLGSASGAGAAAAAGAASGRRAAGGAGAGAGTGAFGGDAGRMWKTLFAYLRKAYSGRVRQATVGGAPHLFILHPTHPNELMLHLALGAGGSQANGGLGDSAGVAGPSGPGASAPSPSPLPSASASPSAAPAAATLPPAFAALASFDLAAELAEGDAASSILPSLAGASPPGQASAAAAAGASTSASALKVYIVRRELHPVPRRPRRRPDRSPAAEDGDGGEDEEQADPASLSADGDALHVMERGMISHLIESIGFFLWTNLF